MWNCFFSNIFWKYTCWLVGGSIETLDFQIKGSIFACVEKKCTIFWGQSGDYGIEWKMALNHGFTIQMGVEGQNTWNESIMGAREHIFALYILF